jgi:hypothetical protein
LKKNASSCGSVTGISLKEAGNGDGLATLTGVADGDGEPP